MLLMKKTFFLLCFIALPFLLKGQTKTFTIPWEGNATSNFVSAKKTTATLLKEKAMAALSLQIDKENLSYKTQWRDTGFADENSLTLTNVAYGPLSSEELKTINTSLVPDRLTYSIASTMGRDVLYTLLTVSPVVKSNGSYQKVLSFSVNYRMKSLNRNGAMRMPISNSVLATGEWFKFKIEATGIYKIDKAFLNSLGMNTDGINPRNLKVYSNGGKPLPLLNSLNNVFDLPQTSIQVVGEADGSFDGADYILFYGIGTKGYSPENDTHINPYSEDSFYYVTADGGPGNRVQSMTEPTGNATITITQFDDYKFHELDEESPTKLGRRWFGNRFDIESEQTYEFTFPNIVAGQPMNLKVKAAAISETATSMALSINGTSLDPLNFSGLGDNGVISLDAFSGQVPAGSETVTVDLAYNNSGNPSSVAYLDYISIEAVRNLTGADGQMAFRYNDAQNLSGIGEYQLSNAAQFSQVWDVTNPTFISSVQNEGNGASIGFKVTLGELREYVAVHQTDFFSPIKISQSRVQNQNLKGTIFNDGSGNFQDIDYLIITAPFLLQPALRLANHHKTLSGLNVKVVTTDKIYEEFSSGKQDIGAIRNFVRYVYENASSENNRVKYLGILGDTSIDYKDRLAGNNNIVPSFHTLSVDNTVASFVSDDFFGNLDSEEGTIGGATLNELGEILTDIDRLDVALGRIIAEDVVMANAMVDKIINYTSKASYGNWRTNFILISDDVDKPGEQQLEVGLDALGDEISAQKPFVNVKKIHSDAYLQQTSAGGNIYPDVNEAIKNAIDVGAVIMNYFGHGNEDGLAGERIFTKAMAREFQNKNNLPCIVTITCQFTKFDNPLRLTAGEITYQNKEGGAISLVTTTRSISIGLGQQFNEFMADELFGFGVNIPETPAEGLRRAKNDINNNVRRVVFYIGDPAMRLAFPKQEIRLTTLNGVPISQSTDILKALSKVKLEGEVTNENGTIISNYNGILEAKLYDKNVQRQTLANDQGPGGFIMNFTTLGEGLFNGQATVANGRFEFEFVVPRDIQIPVGNGRLSLYAQRNDEFEDHTGVNLDLKVGGLNENAPADNVGPLIRLFMNDESFVSGGLTNDSPILIAKLEDPNGINTASGIGHDIVAILDGDESNPFLLNEYYQAEVDDYTRGMANYNFRDLEDGLHTLTLKAWDVYNNSSTAEIQFIVAGNDKLEINRVLNYPNPFVNYTEFWFSHNREFQELEVQVQVFTVTGKVVWTKSGIYPPNGSNLFREIVWDGRDDFGDRIGKGVYVYKITVKSPLTNHRVEKFEKLVIL